MISSIGLRSRIWIQSKSINLSVFNLTKNLAVSSSLTSNFNQISSYNPKNSVFGQRFNHTAAKIIDESKLDLEKESAQKTFDSIDAISDGTKKVLDRNYSFKTLTPVQDIVLSSLPVKNDILVRAKTGTGKTLAFLIAAIESIKADHGHRAFRGKGPDVIIIAPTRDIALQITDEARKLCRDQGIAVFSAVGGTPYNHQIIERSRIGILVCTPGRLLDLMEQGVASMDIRVRNCKVLILDEADRLLDLGFERDLRNIMSFLNEDRMNYMFSATFSKEVKSIAASILSKDYKDIDTVHPDDKPVQTLVKQTYSMVPMDQSLSHLYEVLLREKKTSPKNHKTIVFCNSINTCALLSDIFSTTKEFRDDIFTLHSKLSQQARSSVSRMFHSAQSGILFTTDVSARGVDYPNVNVVINYGCPTNYETYIHRVGRSGRGGKEGRAMLILSPYEKNFLNVLQQFDIPISADSLQGDSEVVINSIAHDCINPETMPISLRSMVINSTLGSSLQALSTMKLNSQVALNFTKEFAQKVLKINSPILNYNTVKHFGNADFSGFRVSLPDGSVVEGNEVNPPATSFRGNRPQVARFRGKYSRNQSFDNSSSKKPFNRYNN